MERRNLHHLDSRLGYAEENDLIDAKSLFVKSGLWTDRECTGYAAPRVTNSSLK